MALIVHVSTGAVVTGSDLTMTIASPAGAIGDILTFWMIHDDFGDGAFVPNAPPITMNSIHDGSPQLGDDSRSAFFQAEEDQAAGRNFTFDWTTAEGFQGVCIRYRNQDTGTPIQAASVLRRASESMTPADVGQFGAMAFYFIGGDVPAIATDIVSPPTGYTQRLASGVNGTAMYIADRAYGEDGYPFPHAPGDVSAHYPDTGSGPFGSNGTYGVTFVMTNDATSRTISGVTRDNNGDPLGLVDVALLKSDGASPPNYARVDEVVSTAGTGAYSFTVLEDDEARFMIAGNLQGSPDTFDVGSNELAPV